MLSQLLKNSITLTSGLIKNNNINYNGYLMINRFYSTAKVTKEDLGAGFHETSDDVDQQRIKHYINGLDLKGKSVNIYRPSRNTMQTGTLRTKKWVVELPYNEKWHDRLMGWWASKDTLNQLNLNFRTETSAVEYCKQMGLNYNVIEEDFEALQRKKYGFRFRYRGQLEGEENNENKIK